MSKTTALGLFGYICRILRLYRFGRLACTDYLREISSMFFGVRVGVYCLLLSWTDFYGQLNLTDIACDIDSFVEHIFQALLTYLGIVILQHKIIRGIQNKKNYFAYNNSLHITSITRRSLVWCTNYISSPFWCRRSDHTPSAAGRCTGRAVHKLVN